MHQSGHIIFFVKFLIFGTKFITAKVTSFMMFIPTFGVGGAVCTLFSLSADRLLAIAIPIKYTHFQQSKYIMKHLIFIVIYIVHYTFEMVYSAISQPNLMVSGGLSDLRSAPPGAKELNQYLNLAVALGSVFNYLVVGILIKLRTDTSDDRIKKLYRSLSLIVLINIGGYLIFYTFIAFTHLPFIQLTPVQYWYCTLVYGLFLNTAAASVGPILYLNSDEYREAFKRGARDLLKFIFCKTANNSTKVIPMTAQR
uniref:Serpentine receptor class gamma n=1 Tax=Meloidogyne incognita TaxID=6306 RepID=A0A914MC17_MELIC